MEALTRTECSLLSAVLRRRSLRSAAGSVGMTRASATRLIRRLETKNGTRLVVDDAGQPGLTAPGRVLLRASLDLHGFLGEHAAVDTADEHDSVRIASCLETPLDVDDLARLDPPLVVDVTETDGGHALELFDGGYTDAVATWDLPGTAQPSRDAVAVPLFQEDLWVVGRDVPAGVTTVEDLPDDLAWVTTSCQADLLRAVIGLPEDCPRVHVVESRHAQRVLVLSGKATGLVPASQRERYQGYDLRHVLPVGATRTAVLHTDRRCDVPGRLAQIQGMFRDRHRRMARTPQLGGRGPAGAPGPVRTLELGDVTVLRAIDRHGSLNRAATELCLTQPALTRRLRKLEDRIGSHLVVRTATGSNLTPEASAMVTRVDQALARFHANVSAALPAVTLGRPGRPTRSPAPARRVTGPRLATGQVV